MSPEFYLVGSHSLPNNNKRPYTYEDTTSTVHFLPFRTFMSKGFDCGLLSLLNNQWKAGVVIVSTFIA